MRFKKEERDTLNFCAESLAALSSLKGNTEANASHYVKVLSNLVSGETAVEAGLKPLKPAYNMAADIVCAAIYNMSQGNHEAGLKMFATIADAEDSLVLAQSLMRYNEVATDLVSTEAGISDNSDGFGETDDDYINEDDDTLDDLNPNGSTTMEEDEPLLGGEQDVLYFDADNTDSEVDDSDDGDIDEEDDIVMASLDTLEDQELQAAFDEGDDEDIKPCSTDPITDRKLSENRKKPEKKSTHLYDGVDAKEEEEKKVEARLQKVLSSKAFKSLDSETRREISSAANKLSMPGGISDKKKAVAFITATLNTLKG